MSRPEEPGSRPSAAEVKSCCAAHYGSDWARLLLGDSFHPGGLALTERLGDLLRLGPEDRVLDVAAGRGTSAIHLARRFGCRVTGIDLSHENVRTANEAASRAGLGSRVRFVQDDAERLRLDEGTFPAVVCECAFCTFPDKAAAAAEFARVLRPGGRLGLADLTRNGGLPEEMDGLLAWVACLGDSRPIHEYVAYLRAVGFAEPAVEPHQEALRALVRDIRGRLLGAELMARIGGLPLPLDDLEQAKRVAGVAAAAIDAGLLGYSLLATTRL